MEERHADDGGDFRDSVGAAGVPRRCVQSQRKVWYSGLVLAGRRGAFSATGDPVRRFPWSQGRDTPGSQKAPSAKRCIKTRHNVNLVVTDRAIVRKHRAPKGALRRAVWGGCGG